MATWEKKIIKNITDFPLIRYDFIIFFKYDILTRGLFRGKERLDGFPKLLILCTSFTTFTKICSLRFLINGSRDIPLRPGDVYMSFNWVSLVQVIACRLIGTKPLPEPILNYSQLDSCEQNLCEILIEIQRVSPKKMSLKMSCAKRAAISQTTFSGAFPWMKTFEYWTTFHWIMFLRV